MDIQRFKRLIEDTSKPMIHLEKSLTFDVTNRLAPFKVPDTSPMVTHHNGNECIRFGYYWDRMSRVSF